MFIWESFPSGITEGEQFSSTSVAQNIDAENHGGDKIIFKSSRINVSERAI